MDQRIESFLGDVLALAGEEPDENEVRRVRSFAKPPAFPAGSLV
jgi:hypothetical protein